MHRHNNFIELINNHLKTTIMNRFFTVTNEEGRNIAVIEHKENETFDSLLMQAISEEYNAEDIAMDRGFKIEQYHGKPITIPVTVYDDSGDFKEDFQIMETAVYKSPKFPNGFESWQETHFEVVNYISLDYERNPEGHIAKIYEEEGTGGGYQLAKSLTDKFEKLYEGKEWDGEFFEAIESFLMQKLNG